MRDDGLELFQLLLSSVSLSSGLYALFVVAGEDLDVTVFFLVFAAFAGFNDSTITVSESILVLSSSILFFNNSCSLCEKEDSSWSLQL